MALRKLGEWLRIGAMKKLTYLAAALGVMVWGGGVMAQAETEETGVTGETVVLEMYHGDGCPHCAAQLAWLPNLEEAYPELEIVKYEVWKDEENRQKWVNRMAELQYDGRQGVPFNVIGGEVVNGFNAEALLDILKPLLGEPAVAKAQLLEAQQAARAQEVGEAAAAKPLEGTNQWVIWGVLGLVVLGLIFFLMPKQER